MIVKILFQICDRLLHRFRFEPCFNIGDIVQWLDADFRPLSSAHELFNNARLCLNADETGENQFLICHLQA